jgi:hypothetical protein
VPSFSIGRTRRGWAWAAVAVAAGLLIMFVQRGDEREQSNPEVASRNVVRERQRAADQALVKQLGELARDTDALELLAEDQNVDRGAAPLLRSLRENESATWSVTAPSDVADRFDGGKIAEADNKAKETFQLAVEEGRQETSDLADASKFGVASNSGQFDFENAAEKAGRDVAAGVESLARKDELKQLEGLLPTDTADFSEAAAGGPQAAQKLALQGARVGSTLALKLVGRSHSLPKSYCSLVFKFRPLSMYGLTMWVLSL